MTGSVEVGIEALVLAGGRSLRMGHDKARIELDGEPLAARQAGVLVEAGIERVHLSLAAGQPDPAPELGLPIIRDALDAEGPLAGIVAGLERVAPGALLVLAVDMPRVGPELLRELIAVHAGQKEITVSPRVEGRWEPLCAIWSPTVLPEARRRLRAGQRSPSALLDALDGSGRVRPLALPPERAEELRSWNRPEDLPDPKRRDDPGGLPQ